MAKFKIQSAEVGTENWETVIESDSPEKLLSALVEQINGDWIDTENNMLRLKSE